MFLRGLTCPWASVLACLLALVVWSPISSLAQTTVARDPQGVLLAQGSLTALAGTTTITDLTLQGSATYTAGSDIETGAVTLLASGNLASRLTLNLTNGQRTEIRNGALGAWIGPDGVQHRIAGHNCSVDADWFYPAFTLQALRTDTTLGVAYLGSTSIGGRAAVLLEFFHATPGQSSQLAAQDQALSAFDIYFDASSYLPLAVDFNLHPDNNQISKIAVEVQFGDYRPVNGVQVPFHIQKYLQGTLVLDLVVTSVSINSGVPESDFAVQAPIIRGRP